jgi:hypothetical protein
VNIVRTIRRTILRIQGIDPEELDGELRRMDEAKRKRDAEKEQAEREARRRLVETRMRARRP